MNVQESKSAPVNLSPSHFSTKSWANPAPVQASTTPKLTRILVVVVVSLLTIVGVVVGLRWGWYRYQHVVVSQALVRGVVTKLGARFDGRIKNIEVEPGEQVAKGDILLTMEDAALQAALDRARAELQSATKELESERLNLEQMRRSLSLEIDQAEGVRKKAGGEMEAAQGNLASLEKQFERVAALVNDGLAATNQMDQITGARDQAKGMANATRGALDAANSSYQKAMNDLAGIRVLEAHLAVLEAQVAVARAKVAQAEADQQATILRAPADGQVLERLVEVGGSAKVGEPMISLWLGRGWVEAWTDERDLAKFEIGSPADIILRASPGCKFSGRVEAIGLQSDKQLQPTPVPTTLHSFLPPPSAMVPVRIALTSDNCRLELGLSAIVGIKKNRKGTDGGQRMVMQPSPPGKVEGGLVQGQRQVINNK